MGKRITILGSTGSIGTQALRVMEGLGDEFVVQGLSARSNVGLLCQQAQRFHPNAIAIE